MGIARYGRRAIRRIERETGEQVVHAAGWWATTIDHRHLEWDGEWRLLPWREPPVRLWESLCGLPTALSSCTDLFGADETGARRHFMRGACRDCGVGPAELHRASCLLLQGLLCWRSINPDYWPKPVHRPLWQDDPRRRLMVG